MSSPSVNPLFLTYFPSFSNIFSNFISISSPCLYASSHLCSSLFPFSSSRHSDVFPTSSLLFSHLFLTYFSPLPHFLQLSSQSISHDLFTSLSWLSLLFHASSPRLIPMTSPIFMISSSSLPHLFSPSFTHRFYLFSTSHVFPTFSPSLRPLIKFKTY